MPQGYQIYDQSGLYYLTLQVIDWVDVFSRKNHRDIIINSLDYCRKEKGLQIYAYVIMTNHIHLLTMAKEGNLSNVIRDFKKFTASQILKAIATEPESRRDWMLKRFEFAAKSNVRSSFYQFWTHENHAISCIKADFTKQKLDYIHNNPVRAGFVEKPEDWLYSSARNYAGLRSLIEIDFL